MELAHLAPGDRVDFLAPQTHEAETVAGPVFRLCIQLQELLAGGLLLGIMHA